jgi:hypothetical protein
MQRGKLIDLTTVHQMLAEGLSKAEISRQLGVPVSTLKDRLRQALPMKTTDVHNGRDTEVHTGGATEVYSSGAVYKGSAANVHIDLPIADMADFQEMLAWWRRRRHLLGKANEAPAPTERWTLHVEKPFIEKIKAEAEAEHVTVTEVINRIIRHYYAWAISPQR